MRLSHETTCCRGGGLGCSGWDAPPIGGVVGGKAEFGAAAVGGLRCRGGGGPIRRLAVVERHAVVVVGGREGVRLGYPGRVRGPRGSAPIAALEPSGLEAGRRIRQPSTDTAHADASLRRGGVSAERPCVVFVGDMNFMVRC